MAAEIKTAARSAPQAESCPTTQTAIERTQQTAPRTLTSEMVDLSRAFFREDSSGLDTKQVKKDVRRVAELAAGEPVGKSITVSFLLGKPELHLKRASLKESIGSTEEFGKKLTSCITRYQTLEGSTPSKAALRLLSISLQKMLRDNPQSRSEVAAMLKEAAQINLKRPADSGWKGEARLPLECGDVCLKVSLNKIGLVSRFMTAGISRDVPKDDRWNRFGYKIELHADPVTESDALRGFKNLARQAVAMGALVSPMFLGVAAMKYHSLSRLVPEFSADPGLQSSYVEAIAVGGICLIGAASAMAKNWLKNRLR